MVDIVSAQDRSRMMAGIRSANTKPELILRTALHSRGFRYRLHDRRLPGSPDLVLPRYRAVIFVNGCFWHGHDCHLFKWPSTRPEFWKAKINGNVERDKKNRTALQDSGWRVATIWECALKGRTRQPADAVVGEVTAWLKGNTATLDVRGT